MNVRLVAVAVSVLLNSGCVLFNPYVHVRESDGSYKKPALESTSYAGGMEKAISQADEWRIEYIKAASVHSKARNVSAAAILPLTATSLFYGVSGHGSTDRITRMMLGGATLYGANEFLTSRPRQGLYLAGASAMTCAIVASRPYLVTNEWYCTFESHAESTIEALAEHNQATEVLKGHLASAESVSAKSADLRALITSSKAIVTQAEIASRDASTLLRRSAELRARIDQSGQELLGVVRAINDRVNQEMLKTEPDLQSLKGIASSTLSAAQDLSGSAWPKAAAESEKERGDGTGDTSANFASLRGRGDTYNGLLAARKNVIDTQSNLAKQSLILLSDAQYVARLEQVSTLDDCVPAELKVPLTVLPAGDKVALKVGQPFVIGAEGGTGWLSYRLTGPKTDALNVSIVTQRTSSLAISVKANEKIADGQGPTLTISDESGQARKSLSVSAE